MFTKETATLRHELLKRHPCLFESLVPRQINCLAAQCVILPTRWGKREANIQRQFKCFKTHHGVDVAIEDMAFI